MSDEMTSIWDKITTGLAAVWSSFIRTVTPMVVGFIVSLLVSWGIPVNDEFKAAITAALTAIFGALYYLLARLLEQSYSWASKLLLSSKTPVAYAPAKAVAANTVVAAPAATVGTVRTDTPPPADPPVGSATPPAA